jgi:methionyl aminopeptidase
MAMVKTVDEIQRLRNVCKVTALILKKLIRDTRVGDTGLEINNRAFHLFNDMGLEPVFHGYQGFPAMMCISKNEYLIHGIPDNEPFKEGDVIKYDIGGRLEGYCSDTARTFILGQPKDKKHEELVKNTRHVLDKVISRIREGITLKNIAEEIETGATMMGLGNVIAYGGHGIGINLQEQPFIGNCTSQVRENIVLQEGMVIAIEPTLTLGTGDIIKEDKWAVKTADGSIGAHFEDVVLVQKHGNEILTK